MITIIVTIITSITIITINSMFSMCSNAFVLFSTVVVLPVNDSIALVLLSIIVVLLSIAFVSCGVAILSSMLEYCVGLALVLSNIVSHLLDVV